LSKRISDGAQKWVKSEMGEGPVLAKYKTYARRVMLTLIVLFLVGRTNKRFGPGSARTGVTSGKIGKI
jgi:hypothetical protein